MQATLPAFEGIEERAIREIQEHEPEKDYYFANSYGKDSCVVRHLLIKSGVKWEGWHHLTTIDPPEVTRFGRENHPETKINRPAQNMMAEMLKQGIPPMRNKRWCCRLYKHNYKQTEGQVKVMGIRWEESAERGDRWSLYDEDEKVLNPIIGWAADELWDYIRFEKISCCSLYSEGFHRLGCVLCPMSTRSKFTVNRQLQRWPRICDNWKRWMIRLYEKNKNKDPKLVERWVSGEDMFNWWLNG